MERKTPAPGALRWISDRKSNTSYSHIDNVDRLAAMVTVGKTIAHLCHAGLCYLRLRGTLRSRWEDKCCLESWRRERGLFGGVACTGHLRRVRFLHLEQEVAKRGWGVANGCARDRDWEMLAIRASISLIVGVCAAPVVLKPVTALLQFSTVTCLPFCTERVPSPSHRPPLQLRFAHVSPNSKHQHQRARFAPRINIKVQKGHSACASE
jgi:hypothetical protein